MRALEEILNTPVLLLTSEEINLLPEKDRAWAHNAQAKRAKEVACQKHEPTGTSTQSGYHSLRCKHCGMDMSYDSGD